jgi:hypothetical protein
MSYAQWWPSSATNLTNILPSYVCKLKITSVTFTVSDITSGSLYLRIIDGRKFCTFHMKVSSFSLFKLLQKF